MLEQIDLSRAIDKQEHQQRLPDLQVRLYDVERGVVAARLPVLIVFEGWAGSSKVATISAMTRRLDPRGIRVHPTTPPRTSEMAYPWLYRFWLKTPIYGQVAIFDRSWYREALAAREAKQLSGKQWRARCEDIAVFERQLANDGAVVLKFFLHISKQEQARRFADLLANRLTAFQVTRADQRQHKHYKRVLSITDDMLARTSTPHAPWVIVPANDQQYAQIAVIETVLHTLEARLERTPSHAYTNGSAAPQPAAGPNSFAAHNSSPPLMVSQATSVLGELNLAQKLDDSTYSQKLAKLQAKLYLLGLEVYRQNRPVVLVFEGWDAAGKGGTIKRITERLDPRAYVVHTIAAPEGEDKAHHYLYRFWRRLPARGQIAIFDRSWYGRVLVERVEGFARPDEWQRAYAEINEFERQLVDFGTIVCKFWLHVSREEQLRRFEQRQAVDYKAWKLTDEDWRNREKWPLYEQAADEMLVRNSTPCAPWTVVEAEDKRFGRIKAISQIVRRLEDELGKVKL